MMLLNRPGLMYFYIFFLSIHSIQFLFLGQSFWRKLNFDHLLSLQANTDQDRYQGFTLSSLFPFPSLHNKCSCYSSYYIRITCLYVCHILISEKDTLPTIPTQQGQTVYNIGLPIYFVEYINLIRVWFFFYIL